MMEFISRKFISNKALIKNYFWRSLQIFGKHGFAFVNFIMFLKLLSPHDYGVYSYITSSIFFLAIFADFGISGAVQKHVTEYNAVDKKKLKYLLFNSTIVILSVSVLLSLLAVLFGKSFLGENYVYVLYVLPVLFLSTMVGLYSGIYMGLQKFKFLSIAAMSVGAFSVITNYFLVSNFGLVGALINQNVFYGLLLAVLALGYRDWKFQLNKHVLKPIINYSVIIGITTLSYYLYSRADIIILGKFGYLEQIAYYNALTRVFEMMIIPFTIYGQVSGPIIGSLYAKKLFKKVRSDFEKNVIAILILGVIISIASYFIVPLVIQKFFIEYFNDATLSMFSLLIFLLPIRMIAAYVGAAHTGPTGNARFSLWPMIIAGVANVFLDIYFIGVFGFIGVVYSTLMCYTFAIAAFSIRYYAELKKLDGASS